MAASETQRWMAEENQIILDFGSRMTSESLAKLLPGRSAKATAEQRRRLGVRGPEPAQTKVTNIGARPLLAKTCTACGRLLQAEWFGRDTRRGSTSWRSRCRICRGLMEQSSHYHNPTPAQKERKREASADWIARAQELTRSRATRNNVQYTSKDHEVLSDPDLTILQKALSLGRTYSAVASACLRAGHRSAYGLGEPTDLWLIFNPNEGNANRAETFFASPLRHPISSVR